MMIRGGPREAKLWGQLEASHSSRGLEESREAAVAGTWKELAAIETAAWQQLWA